MKYMTQIFGQFIQFYSPLKLSLPKMLVKVFRKIPNIVWLEKLHKKSMKLSISQWFKMKINLEKSDSNIGNQPNFSLRKMEWLC